MKSGLKRAFMLTTFSSLGVMVLGFVYFSIEALLSGTQWEMSQDSSIFHVACLVSAIALTLAFVSGIPWFAWEMWELERKPD
jgi:hypothetical protein